MTGTEFLEELDQLIAAGDHAGMLALANAHLERLDPPLSFEEREEVGGVLEGAWMSERGREQPQGGAAVQDVA